jgi:hypothetical protein
MMREGGYARMQTWGGRWPVVAVLLLAWSPAVRAVSVTIGPPDLSGTGSLYSCDGPGCYYAGAMNTALPAGANFASPADGTISGWRVHGTMVSGGVIKLHVARPQLGGAFMSVATTQGSLYADGVTANPGSPGLQVHAGDTISVLVQAQNMSGWSAGVYAAPTAGASWAGIGLFGTGQTATPGLANADATLLYNATIDLFAPSPGALTPTSGPATGGTTITITGIHLAELTGVTFGGAAATSFSVSRDLVTGVDTVTAVSPLHAGGPVNVVVSTAGGSAQASPAFTYDDVVAPTLTALAISRAAFRAANFGGPVADGAPQGKIGATVSYSQSEAGTTTFAVERVTGRGPDCVPPGRKRCTRYSAAGSFTREATSGANQFTFSGRVSGTKLRPGRYRLTGQAADAAGNQSETASATFKIRGR